MSSVEDTIRQCILNFPSIFPSRAEVLDHLFAVIGNGYEWYEGELVSEYPVPEGHSPFYRRNEITPDDTRDYDWTEPFNKIIQKTLDEIDDRCLPKKWKLKRPHYPISQYSRILNLPEDIKVDWLEATEEALDLFLDSPERPKFNPLNTPEHIREVVEEDNQYYPLGRNSIRNFELEIRDRIKHLRENVKSEGS